MINIIAFDFHSKMPQVEKTYYERIVDAMEHDVRYTFDDIMNLIEAPEGKATYVYAALGKGIESGNIKKIVTPGENRVYKGHNFELVLFRK